MLDNSVIRLEVRSGSVSIIPGQHYQAYDSVTVVDGSGSLGEQPYVAVREGNDLVLLYADGTEVVLQDYFLGDTLFSMDGLGGVIELPADMAPIGMIDGKALYAFGGSSDAAGSILANSSTFSPLEPLLVDESTGAALIGDGGNLGLALGGLGAGGVGLALMGGGSGGDALPFFAAPSGGGSNSNTVISGSFVAGPVIPGNGLVVDIYDSNGKLIEAGIPLDADGSFSVTLKGTIPNVIAIMRDTNIDPDYRDEATGSDIDLNANLAGIGAGDPQPNGTTRVSLNINPVTTVAARLAGVGPDGTIPEGGISSEEIAESIQKVEDSFGLEDMNGVVPKDIFDEDFNDTDGDIDEGENYGQVLAMLSGKDKLNQGDPDATIEEFVSAIDDAGDDSSQAQSDVRTKLLEGAREFEFNNQGQTENEADLLRAPSLGVERTPEVDGEGETAEPEFSALLEDSLEGTSTGDDPNPNAETIEGFQTLVDTSGAAQDLAALEAGADIPQDVADQLTEENLSALGLTGLAEPSPYLAGFLEALRDAEPEGADTVAELQALLDEVIADLFSTSVEQVDGNVAIDLPAGAETATVSYTPAGADASVDLVLTRDESDAWVLPGDAPEGTEVDADGNLTIPNSALEDGTDVTVTVADAAGNAADATLTGVDNTAPVDPTVEQVDGDVVVGLPTDAETATVSYVPDGATEAVDLEIERNADTGEWESASGDPLPTDFALVGDELTIANSALEDGTDVTVTVADAAGNAAEATLTGVDSAAPAAPTINEGITDQANTVSGTGEAGATVTVREGTTEIGSTTVWTDGNWSFVAASPITDGAELTATQTDPAGNVSEPSAAVTTFTDTDGDGVANTSDTDDDGDTPDPVEVEVIDRLIAVEADSSGPIETTIPGTTGPEPSLITFSGNGARSTTSGFRYPEGSNEANVGDTYTLAFDQPITDIKLFLDNMILGTNIGNFTVTYDDGSTASDLVPTVSQANDFNAPRAGGSLTGLGAFTENGFNAVGDIEGTPDASSTQPNDAQAAGTVSFAGLDANKSISEISWEVTGLTSAVNAETGIGGFVTPIISYDRDPAAFELPDTTEAATESESILSYPAQDPAVNMDIASPSPGYSSSTTTDNSSGSLIDITATAPGESGNLIDTGAGAGVGTVSFFNYRAEVVGNETVEDLSIGISITDFDDGLYVEIDDVVIVSFDASDYAGLDSMAGYDSDGDVAFGFPWAPFNGEGDPELVVDLVNGTVQLLVTESDGTTRSDIFAAMLNDGFDATPNAVPTVDATSPEGVTIGTAFQNSNTNTDDPGSIGVQTITVTGEFGNAADVDVDGIDNWLDIDSDNDGIWDKYEGATDSDGDGVADYRDTDSNGATAGDDRSLASLDTTGVAALESGTPNTDGFILLSEAVSLDLTGPNVDVTDLEYIDMNDGANAQTMTVDETSLIALTDADNELIIVGDSNDTVDASGFEDTGKDQSIQGQTFDIYEASNGATLIIDEEITVTLA